jgi:hypothetical protein
VQRAGGHRLLDRRLGVAGRRHGNRIARALPWPVDIAALAAAIAAQDDAAWLEQVDRQKDYEVHRLTQSIVLLFAEVDPWPRMEVTRQPGWERLSAVAVPLMDSIIARWYPAGGRIIRAMAAKLLPGGKIDPHRDSHPSFNCGHRIHVPITTNPRVRFTVDGRPVQARGRPVLRDQ